MTCGASGYQGVISEMPTGLFCHEKNGTVKCLCWIVFAMMGIWRRDSVSGGGIWHQAVPTKKLYHHGKGLRIDYMTNSACFSITGKNMDNLHDKFSLLFHHGEKYG